MILEDVERLLADAGDVLGEFRVAEQEGVGRAEVACDQHAVAKFRQILEEYPGGKAAKQATSFLKRLEEDE